MNAEQYIHLTALPHGRWFWSIVLPGQSEPWRWGEVGSCETAGDALALVRAHVVMPGPKLRLFEEER